MVTGLGHSLVSFPLSACPDPYVYFLGPNCRFMFSSVYLNIKFYIGLVKSEILYLLTTVLLKF